MQGRTRDTVIIAKINIAMLATLMGAVRKHHKITRIYLIYKTSARHIKQLPIYLMLQVMKSKMQTVVMYLMILTMFKCCVFLVIY